MGFAQCSFRFPGHGARCGLAPGHEGLCAPETKPLERGYIGPPPQPDAVKSYDPPPTHYDGGGIDGWTIVDAFGLDYYLGNVIKYVIRAGKKDIAPRLDDLKKARNYINKAIEREELAAREEFG